VRAKFCQPGLIIWPEIRGGMQTAENCHTTHYKRNFWSTQIYGLASMNYILFGVGCVDPICHWNEGRASLNVSLAD